MENYSTKIEKQKIKVKLPLIPQNEKQNQKKKKDLSHYSRYIISKIYTQLKTPNRI